MRNAIKSVIVSSDIKHLVGSNFLSYSHNSNIENITKMTAYFSPIDQITIASPALRSKKQVTDLNIYIIHTAETFRLM